MTKDEKAYMNSVVKNASACIAREFPYVDATIKATLMAAYITAASQIKASENIIRATKE